MAMGCNWAVVLLILICDSVAFGLAIGAEQHRSTATVEYNTVGAYYYCDYSTDMSSAMGAGGFVALLVGHLIVMGVTKCMCCAKAELSALHGGPKACAVVCFLLVWLCWFISSVCLLAGANRNSVHTKTQSIDIKNIPITCEMMRKGTFGAAAAFAFFNIIFSEVYYILMTKNPPSNSGSGTNPNWQAHGVGSVGSGSSMPPQQSPYAL
ncbi:hypothetical protein Mapa_006876 [Marchantia paleacea]|nr:hypothetical protein Mapa_006876 [Marchantia paleacea]